MKKNNIYTIIFIGISSLLVLMTVFYSFWTVKSTRTAQYLDFLKTMPGLAGHETRLAQDKPAVIEKKSSLTFDPLNSSQTLGQSFDVKIILNTQEQQTYGVDLVIKYDPAMLELQPLTHDNNYLVGGTRIITNWGQGEIIFSCLALPGITWQGEKELAALNFVPLQAGAADLEFIFDSDLALDCTVAGAGGADLLADVFNARFDVE